MNESENMKHSRKIEQKLYAFDLRDQVADEDECVEKTVDTQTIEKRV